MARPVRKKTYNEKVERYTPPSLFEALDYTFDLDPCSPGEGKSFVPARKHYTVKDDGLLREWEGVVFINPPTQNVAAWIDRLVKHGEGIALVTLRPDAAWFQEAAKEADAVCLVEEKVQFFKGGMTKKFATGTAVALLAYGEVAKEIVLTSGLGVSLASENPPAWRSFDLDDEEEVEEGTDGQPSEDEKDTEDETE